MKQEKFSALLREIETGLSNDQAEQLGVFLTTLGDEGEVFSIIEKRLDDDPKCPHCGETKLYRHGMAHGLRRYKCTGCNKTFNALTGTPLARLRKKELWLDYWRCLHESQTVRKAAKRLNVSISTSFRWRHRFLKSKNKSKDQSLTNITEVDELFFPGKPEGGAAAQAQAAKAWRQG